MGASPIVAKIRQPRLGTHTGISCAGYRATAVTVSVRVFVHGVQNLEDFHDLIVGTLAHKNGRKNVMARTFNLDTTVGASSLLAKAKKAAHENSATLVGDGGSGQISHDMVRGEYRMVGQTVIVTIREKHWLLPWPVVEAQLRELVQKSLGSARLHQPPRGRGKP